ncbi:MAG TPA: glycosyltransferase [Bacteroidia bacterium]|nr:glycosyltransferase [Bacteroidia bacterium]
MDRITFIYCFRDRELDRVRLSLESLSLQTDMLFKVIFVDYGSEMNLAVKVQKLVESYPFASYLYNNTRGMMWNRSHALNSAIRMADSSYVFTADIDMIFKPGFVKQINEFKRTGDAYFFSAIMLPPNTLPGNENLEKKYERTTDNALGWGLIPREKLLEINSYDEVYCIWGKEDNDIGHRLRLAGVKVNYISDIWMFHYYHPPVPNQREVLPEDWFMFLKNYFDDSSHDLKRNEIIEWGKILKAEDRPALELIEHPVTAFIPVNGRCRYFRYVMEQKFSELNTGEVLKLIFVDKISETYKRSKLYRLALIMNKFLKLLHFPYQLATIYESGFEDIYFARNELMYFLVTRKTELKDFAYELSGKTMKVILIKS